MTETLKKAIRIIVQVSDPEKIILFGSRACDLQKPQSDYDLLVLKDNVKSQRLLTQQIYLNFKNMGSPIDVIVVDQKKI